ncbi:MAG: PadR family transcriptional regulator [Solirubrobacteraceae bacterium]|nr:PadR family transcriptional regulator [Solirubrobacteraceae bacterium]
MGRPALTEMGPQGPWGFGPKAHRHHGRHGAGPCGPAFYEGHADRGGFAGRGAPFYEGRPDRGGGWGGPGDPFGPMGEGRHGRRGPGGRRGRGPRASRGDIRAAILALLVEEQMHGYQIMREINDRSGGVWRPSPGSIYPTLQQLQDEGLVDGVDSPRGRRLFTLTDEGRTEAESSKGERAPWDQVGEEFTPAQVGLRDLVFQIGAAARQVVVAGTPEQASRAEALLKETRRSLYRILAEDEPEAEDAEAPAAGES